MKITKQQLKEMIVKEISTYDERENDRFFDDNPWHTVLRFVAKSAPAPGEGPGWTIPKEWAAGVIKEFGLEMAEDQGDMSGEASALFDYMGTTLRLKKEFPNKWKVYKGAWKSDPHWTGD